MSKRKTNRKYKDTMFRLLFKEKKELLSLYNATNGTNYDNEDDLEVNTLENAIYMNMKNDISFVLDMELNLYEHQSSVNPNMPLRDLYYVAEILQNITKDKNLYGSKKIQIPTPRFLVFYNGTTKMPERMEYRLSELFQKPVTEPTLELVVSVLNINFGMNEVIKQNCQTLNEYMIYVDKVRKYQKTLSIEDAVEKAITECIKEGILTEFLKKHRAEAKSVSIYEYDQEKHMNFIREEGHEEGYACGLEAGKSIGLQEGKSIGLQEGKSIGLQTGIRAFIEDNLEENVPPDRIIEKLVRRFNLTREKAKEYFDNVKNC